MGIIKNWPVEKNVKHFDLTSPIKIAEQGGTITGSPTFSRAGIDLDGSADYVTYNIANTLFSGNKISIVVEFTPDFAYDENATRYLCDSSASNRYYIIKKNNAASNVLGIFLGNTSIATIASATYSAYWKQNERNVIVISGTTGATDCWLNGTQILTADVTAWSVAIPTNFYVGASNAGATPFDGEIHSISIYNDLLTGDEAQALYDNSLFNFQNKADVWLDMKSQVGKESGTELVSGMTAGDWRPFHNPTLTNPDAETLRIAYLDTVSPAAYKTILTSGKRYRVRGEFRGDGTYFPSIYIGGVTANKVGTTSNTWQEVDFIMTADGINFYLTNNAAGAGYTEFKNLTCELVQQTTKDKSSKGNDFLLGDGDDTAVMPSFSNPGFELDGSSDYMLNSSASGIYNNANQSIVLCFKPDFATNDDNDIYLLSSSAGQGYLILKQDSAGSYTLDIYLGNTIIANIAETTYKPYWITHGQNVLVVAGTTGNTNVWLNGYKILDADNTAWSPADATSITLGASATPSLYFNGEIFHFSTYDFKMTPIQMRSITNDLMRRYST